MIEVIINKCGTFDKIEMKTLDDKFFEFLFCDSRYITKILFDGQIQDINSLKTGYEYRKADVVRNRINTLIMLKPYFVDEKSKKIINSEIQELQV